MPEGPGRWCVAAGAVVALGVVLHPAAAIVAAIVGSVVAARIGHGRSGFVLAVLLVLGALSGMAADQRQIAVETAVVPEGRVTIRGAVREDPQPSYGSVAVVRPIELDGEPWPGPPIGVGPLDGAEAGDEVVVEGRLVSRPGRVRNDTVAGMLRVDEVLSVEAVGGPLFAVGNAIRSRVRTTFGGLDPDAALVSGLLIGDTDRLPAGAMEDLRRSGLAHYVAVSGSNVALFLLAWWLVGVPLAIRPRVRAVYGLVGLAIFAVVTRWEPSVLRASAMAAVPLLGGLVGVPVDPWMALGTAVAVVLLVSGDLLASVGFQLSVAATVGVLVGIGVVRARSPRWLWYPLGATIGAQLAVAPIILVTFGTMPLLAPLANLVVAPIVTVTTGVAMAATVLPLPALVGGARLGAGAVLEVASAAATGPQLGAPGVIAVAAVAGAVWVPRFRPVGLAAGLVLLLSVPSSAPSWPSVPTMVVLDVGQGDATLLLDPSGRAVLIDGGRSPRILDIALRRHGVDRLDIVVVTHGDSDHAGGLGDLVAHGPVGELWMAAHGSDSTLDGLVDAAERRDIPVRRVAAGDEATVGSIRLDVLGPGRRFLSDNDGSVVLLATAGRTALLPGDIEAVAQAELPPLRPDILVVPHHGAGTTDRRWLEATVGPVAVLSYGENRFGHPHPDIVDILHRADATVFHTHLDGDVVLPLGRPHPSTSARSATLTGWHGMPSPAPARPAPQSASRWSRRRSICSTETGSVIHSASTCPRKARRARKSAGSANRSPPSFRLCNPGRSSGARRASSSSMPRPS